MFQLSPVSLKPVVRASKDQHAPFELKLIGFIKKTSEEKEVVDLNYEKAKKLLNYLDIFMCYGLYSGDKAYWPFVREFLPKSEAQLLKVEWKCTSDRALSIAWLKDALNRGSLNFQLLSFSDARKIICRYYHPNACIRNWTMLEKVANETAKLTQVQFSFNSPSTIRQEYVPNAVVVDAPPLPLNRRKPRKLKRQDTEIECERDIIPPNLLDRPLPTQLDQEYILNEFVRTRRNRMNGKFERTSQSGSENNDPAPSSSHEYMEKGGEERLDKVLEKSMSMARMESLVDITEPRSFDSLLGLEELKSRADRERLLEEETVEGEIHLPAGEIVQLMMNVFLDPGEKTQKCFHVYENFVVGRPAERLFLITDRNIYILSQRAITSGTTTELENQMELVHTSMIYVSHCVISMESIDYIGVGDDCQTIMIFAKEDRSFQMKRLDETTSEKVVSVAVGEQLLGDAVVNGITKASESAHPGGVSVFSDNTSYALIVRRFLKKELKAPDVKLLHTALVYWRETSAAMCVDEVSHSGYLYHRVKDPSWWRKTANDWSQSFFLLKGRKLYIFSDSTCKVGERVVNLSGGSVETQEVELKRDYPFVFEISFPLRPEETPFQLACPSREEMAKWMHLISITLSAQDDGEDIVACSTVITETHLVVFQEGEKCLQDEFMRSLIVFPLEDFAEGIILRMEQHMALLLEAGDVLEWFFFRSEHELDRMVKSLEPLIKITHLDNYEKDRMRPIIFNQARRVPELWHKAVFGCETTENADG